MIFLMILLKVSFAHQGCIYLIKIRKYYETLLQSKTNVFFFNLFVKYNLFLWCKAEFSASLLQSSVSHDPSEIILICWFAAQETFLIINNAENSCAASYSCGNRDTIYFSKFKRTAFCNIINDFTVTYDQFNASLINKSINFFEKNSVFLFGCMNVIDILA